MNKTIEQQVSDTILQQPTEIQVGEKKYSVAPPSIATLILVSKEISKLPKITVDKDEDILAASLSMAKDCGIIGRIAATLILGAKNCKDKTIHVPKKKTKRILWGLIPVTWDSYEEQTHSTVDELAKELLEQMTPREINNTIARILQGMQIGDFFGVTTFLLEVNLTKRTKVE